MPNVNINSCAITLHNYMSQECSLVTSADIMGKEDSRIVQVNEATMNQFVSGCCYT